MFDLFHPQRKRSEVGAVAALHDAGAEGPQPVHPQQIAMGRMFFIAKLNFL